MRQHYVMALVGLWLFCAESGACWAQAEKPAPERLTSYEELFALGEALVTLDDYRDNAFLYQEKKQGLREYAASLSNAQLTFAVRVARVTTQEVLVEVDDAGKTRVVLRHAALPLYGNLRTVQYSGPPSTHLLHMYSRPVGLRIDSEIPLDIARTLRRRDLVVLQGKIESVGVWIESQFDPVAIAVVVDWKAVDVVRGEQLSQ